MRLPSGWSFIKYYKIEEDGSPDLVVMGGETCTRCHMGFIKNGPFPASFSLYSSFQYTVDSKQMFIMNKFLPMTGFEPRTSGIGSDHSTNWAKTTAQLTRILTLCLIKTLLMVDTYLHRQLVVSISRLSAPSCHLLGKINAMGTFFSMKNVLGIIIRM